MVNSKINCGYKIFFCIVILSNFYNHKENTICHHNLSQLESQMARPPWKRPGVLLAAAGVYAASTAFAYLTFVEPKAEAESMSDARRVQVFNANAAQYDKGAAAVMHVHYPRYLTLACCLLPAADVDLDEMLMGISLMRRFLLRAARGRVLEVAAGTGRNLPFYAPDAQLTLTDTSAGMLAQIPAKATAAGRSVRESELREMSAGALAFPDETFDTVVDTFGLCSMDDSVAALEEMQRVCKRRGGRVLLLEHGRSHYAWLSRLLDKFAAQHAQRWGCHWNRDILALVAAAGLEVETVHRFHFGTTYYIVARPRGAAAADAEQEQQQDEEERKQ